VSASTQTRCLARAQVRGRPIWVVPLVDMRSRARWSSCPAASRSPAARWADRA